MLGVGLVWGSWEGKITSEEMDIVSEPLVMYSFLKDGAGGDF